MKQKVEKWIPAVHQVITYYVAGISESYPQENGVSGPEGRSEGQDYQVFPAMEEVVDVINPTPYISVKVIQQMV